MFYVWDTPDTSFVTTAVYKCSKQRAEYKETKKQSKDGALSSLHN